VHQAFADHVGVSTIESVGLFTALAPLMIPIAILAGVVVLLVWAHRRHKALEAAYRQACVDHQLTPTSTPLGLSAADLVRFHLLPRGDRRHGVAWGMQGPAEARLGGIAVTATCVAFQWWWEERHTETDSEGNTRTTYSRRALLAGLVHLPPPYVMPDVRVKREGLFTRMGIGGRGDFQVESEEFNRRYDVRVSDRETAIRLFDPAFQERMLGPLTDATFELTRDLALMVGRAPSGMALIQALPRMRQHVVGLLQTMPDGWWRAVSHAAS
jgi:hypothetical protein